MGRMKTIILKMLETLEKSYTRFPETIAFSIIFVLFAIIRNRMDEDPSHILRNLLYVSALGIPLSGCVVQTVEGFNKKRLYRMVGLIAMFLYAVTFYVLMPEETKETFLMRYAFASSFAYLLFATIPYLLKRRQYGLYLIKLITSFLITYLYTLVLYLGIIAIIFTVDVLFNLNIDEAIYFDIFVTSVGVFGLTYFLGLMPERHDNLTEYHYPKVFKVLFTAIVMPLITVYTVVLYAYLIRILVVVGWRDTMISQLILWYGFVSIVLLMLIKPLNKTSKWVDKFLKFYPAAMLVPVIMLCINMTLRVMDYGATVPRLLVLISASWFLIIVVYEILPIKTIHQYVTLAYVVLFGLALFFPVNVFGITINNQIARLETTLTEQGLLTKDGIIPRENVDPGIMVTVSSQLEVLQELDAMNKATYLPEDFKLNDMENVFGFGYRSPYYRDGFGTEFITFFASREALIDIRDYDYHRPIRIHDDNNGQVVLTDGQLFINDEVVGTMTINIEAYIKTHEIEFNRMREEETIPLEITVNEGDVTALLVVYDLSGEMRDDNITLNYLEGDLYYTVKP